MPHFQNLTVAASPDLFVQSRSQPPNQPNLLKHIVAVDKLIDRTGVWRKALDRRVSDCFSYKTRECIAVYH